jgi:hypothetical protein
VTTTGAVAPSPRAREFGFFSDPDPRTILQVAQSGIGGISMGPYFKQATSVDSSLGTPAGPAQEVIEGMQYARRLGLRVMLKPMVDAGSYPNGGGWRLYLDPADPAAWFSDYYDRAVAPYLPFADGLVIYTEIGLLSRKYPDRWRDMVARARASGFSGPISSDANNGDISVDTTPWYDRLDYLGGSFYPAIDTTTEQTARRDWNAVARSMATAYQETGLPVFMAELVFWAGSDAQLVRFLTTMGEVLGPLPFWAGFSWWRWPQDPAQEFHPTVQRAYASVARAWKVPTAGPPRGTDPTEIRSAEVVVACDALTSAPTAGGPVTRWADRSPAHNDLVATGVPPRWARGFAYGDEPYASFVAGTSALATSAHLGADYTVIVAFSRPSVCPNDQRILDFIGPGTWALVTSRYGQVYYYNGTFISLGHGVAEEVANPPAGGPGPHVWSVQVKALTVVRTRYGGVDLGTFAIPGGTFAPVGLRLGGPAPSVVPGYAGLVAMDGIPDDAELLAVEQWLGHRAGLVL